jgi:hypothetical protein
LAEETIRVEPLMRDIENSVRDELRRRVLAHGGSRDFQDPDVFRSVESLLRRAADRPEAQALMPEFLGPETDWRLETHIRFSSHRPVIGPFLVFAKQRLLMPLVRWLHEYNVDNVRRQQRVNQMLMACVEELAVENARLRRDLQQLRG